MARPRARSIFVFYNPPVVNRYLGIRRGYIGESSRIAQEFLKRGLQTLVFANSRLHTELLLTYLQQANPAAPGATATRARLSRRLSARRTPRDRARPARRPHPRRGFDQRARTGHRRRLPRCRGARWLPGYDRLHLATRRPRRAAQRRIRARFSWHPRRRSINSSCSIRIISSAARPSTRSCSPTIWKFSSTI